MTGDGKLSEPDRLKAISWLNTRWHGTKCDVCGHNSWTISEHLVMPVAFTPGVFSIGGPTYPHVMVTCTNCSQTKFFNAVLMKLDATATPKPEPEGK